jgi:predicted DNA-binding transcriptional regulator AlpA
VTGRGSISTPCPGCERLSWHFERFILLCRALPLLPLSLSLGLVVACFVRLRASSALHQGFDFCGTRESSSKWLICYSWKWPLPRRLGGGRIRWSSQEDCAWLRISCCERSCAHLTRAMKSNSSGIEVWSGSLVLTGSRSSGALIEERLNIESTLTWIRGDRQVIDTVG